ncbi:MAG: nuclear transport factor 2 family protein [Thermodesulfobacteriota bacterium]
MSTQENSKILKINDLFYKALGTRNVRLMKEVWANDEKVGCVHPGWTVLRSWSAIMQSWENVFDPSDQVDINLTDIKINIKGDLAWVTCVQEMVYIKRDPVSYNLSQSTNIFEKTDDEWKLVVHHASPIPLDNYEIKENNLQ